jgi:hypothetical protein
VEGGGGMRIDVGSSSLAFIFLLNRLMPGAIKCLSLNKAIVDLAQQKPEL